MPVSKDDVIARLGAVVSPENVPLPKTGRLSDIVVTDGKVFFSISIAANAIKPWEAVRAQAEAAVKAIPGVVSVMVALTAERAGGSAGAPPRPAVGGGHSHGHGGHSHSHGQPAKQSGGGVGVPGIASIIAVASGKGGVGKSTTSVNLALALRDLGLRVGMLDADIYGPSIPKLLNVREKPETLGGNRLKPITAFGMSVMSIGFLIEEETPMIWRGPMVMSALTQMLREVEWGTLDVLVVDMPPGTGDAQLTMAQQVPLRGAVIVSTPQDLALIDARRGIAMFKRVDVPVLGIVENMSTYICPQCGTESHIFGHGGAHKEAERLGVPFLGEVPLHMAIRETSDAGKPVVATDPEGAHAKAYRAIAMKVRDQIASGGGGRPAPKIVIEA